MNYLLYTRTKMGLSQSKMATYLGVSKSLIYHVEKNLKNLSARLMIKLGELIIRFEKLAGFSEESEHHKDLQLKNRKIGKYKKIRTRLVCKIGLLKSRLKKMKNAFNKCQLRMITNQAVAENIRFGTPGKGDHLWLALNIIDNSAALKHCDRSMQQEIAMKIEELQAKVVMMDEYIRQNSPCFELQVRLKETG